MFDQLFVRSEALTRQLSAPLVDERRQYLTHCAVQGMTKSTLEAKARLLLSEITPPTGLSDAAGPGWPNLKWRNVGGREPAITKARSLTQASRPAFPSTRLCDPSDQPGLSLKEIGDHLGHRDVEATRIYAKVDLARLRDVADFDLRELL
jgi:hypothetical protein